MGIKRWLGDGPMAAAIGVAALMPATSIAAIQQNCAAPQPASSCCTATVAPEAGHLLNTVRRDAEQISRRTDSLEAFAGAPNVDRNMQDRQLEQIQAKVADMVTRLDRLEAMETSLPACEQHLVSAAKPLVQSMANDTASAIGDLKADIQYGGYAQVLHEEAQTVAREVNNVAGHQKA